MVDTHEQRHDQVHGRGVRSGADRHFDRSHLQIANAYWALVAQRPLAIEHRPTDLVAQPLVIQHKIADRRRQPGALPGALAPTSAIAVALRSSSPRCLDR